jgi:cytidylate kinase
MSVIALGGLWGGGARLLGPVLANKISADYVDQALLLAMTEELGLSIEELNKREHLAPSLTHRFAIKIRNILERSGSTWGGDPYFGSGLSHFFADNYEDLPGIGVVNSHDQSSDDYIAVIKSTMRNMAVEGNVVFVGRGSNVILNDMKNVLRIGVVASYEDRIKNVMKIDNLDYELAIKAITNRDAARRNYFKKYFDIDEPDNPNLYHLTINTSEVILDYASELAVQSLEALLSGKMHVSS